LNFKLDETVAPIVAASIRGGHSMIAIDIHHHGVLRKVTIGANKMKLGLMAVRLSRTLGKGALAFRVGRDHSSGVAPRRQSSQKSGHDRNAGRYVTSFVPRKKLQHYSPNGDGEIGPSFRSGKFDIIRAEASGRLVVFWRDQRCEGNRRRRAL